MSPPHKRKSALTAEEVAQAANMHLAGIESAEIARHFNVTVAKVSNPVGVYLKRMQIDQARFVDTQSKGHAEPAPKPTMAELCKPLSARLGQSERASESRRQATQIMHLRKRMKPGARRT